MRKALIFGLALSFIPLLVFAQNALVKGPSPNAAVGESCFDYYKFQSVEIDLHGEKQVYKAGEGAKLLGSLTNKNNYPLIGGSLVLRVSKLDPRSQVGNDIIDEWVAEDGVNLMAGEKQFVSFPYQIPSGLPTGAYVLTSYFLTQNKFNISGLSFTDDIYGGYSTFTVEGRSEKVLRFDRSGVKADGKPYRIFGFLPKVFPADTKSIAIGVPLKNDTNKSLKTSVAYSIYGWDGADKSNLAKSWFESVDLAANSSKTLSFNLDTLDRPVYFIKIKADAGDQESEIHLRFVKDGFRPRLNDIGISSFPVTGGQKSTIFACYHNTTNVSGNGKLDLELLSSTGRSIAKASYAGDISGNIAVLAKDISGQDLDNVTLSAKLYDDKGALVDKADVTYDCSRFSAPLCLKQKINWQLLGLGILIVIAALYFLLKHFRNKETAPTI